jgi:hypothetical protein
VQYPFDLFWFVALIVLSLPLGSCKHKAQKHKAA